MKTLVQQSLQSFNSFNINAIAPKIYLPENIEQLKQCCDVMTEHCYVIGEGSNTLFCQPTTPDILKVNIKGIDIAETDQHYLIKVGCAENWHDFVSYCVDKGINGLENLALIPGSVGAAPVQNIGAYGVEVSNFIEYVDWFDFQQKTVSCLTNSDCCFAYRDSIFKQKLQGKGVITHVNFKLPKAWQAVTSYQGLQDLAAPITAKAMMNKVIEIRQAKLPDPAILPNAGSFFKNPIVAHERYLALAAKYPLMPYYLQSDGQVKLAAGWLIEQAKLKGFREGDVGVHDKQALVIVNYGQANGADIVKLAKNIQHKVADKFNIRLTPEVRYIGAKGLLSENNKVS